MNRFKSGTYDLYGIGENGKRTLLATFVVENNSISYPDGDKSDVFPEGKINFETGLRLKRLLKGQHGYCIVILRQLGS